MNEKIEEIAEAMYAASRPTAFDPVRDVPESWQRLLKYYPEHANYWRKQAKIAYDIAMRPMMKDAEFDAVAAELLQAADTRFNAALHRKLQALIAEAKRSREEELRLIDALAEKHK